MLAIEFNRRFPWVHRHRCAQAVAAAAALPPERVHRTWVMTDQGRGWLHHHDRDGWWVQLEPSGKLIQLPTSRFKHLA